MGFLRKDHCKWKHLSSIWAKMERPEPTAEIIMAVTGDNPCLISSAHSTLYYVSFQLVYQDLNFDELMVIAAGSQRLEEAEPDNFAKALDEMDFYQVLKYINGHELYGFSWLNSNKNIPAELMPLYKALNPFDRHLEERVARDGQEELQTLKDELRPIYPHSVGDVDELVLGMVNWFSIYPTTYDPLH